MKVSQLCNKLLLLNYRWHLQIMLTLTIASLLTIFYSDLFWWIIKFILIKNCWSFIGSPFVIKVSAPPDASKVRVTGPGVEHGILARFQSKFIVETKGAGAGQLTVRVRGPKGNVEKTHIFSCMPTFPGGSWELLSSLCVHYCVVYVDPSYFKPWNHLSKIWLIMVAVLKIVPLKISLWQTMVFVWSKTVLLVLHILFIMKSLPFACPWFPAGTPASSTTKTGRHDIQ